jgi:cytochrome c5
MAPAEEVPMNKDDGRMLALGSVLLFAVALAATLVPEIGRPSIPAGEKGDPAPSGGSDPKEARASGQMMPMRNMMHRMMPDLLPPGTEPGDLPDPDGRGAKLVVRYCWQCHNLPSPSMHSAAEWPAIANRMYLRIDRMLGMMGIEGPSREDRAAIIAYLETYALKSVSAAALPAEPASGAPLFRKYCAQCHALPDPKSHSAAEWDAVVERMQGHLMRTNKKVMTLEEEKLIEAFLAANARKS